MISRSYLNSKCSFEQEFYTGYKRNTVTRQELEEEINHELKIHAMWCRPKQWKTYPRIRNYNLFMPSLNTRFDDENDI